MKTGKRFKVAVVDDEVGIVNAVRRELSTPPLGGNSYEIQGFSDAVQALAAIRAHPVDLVITDYRMPGMDGLAFLRELTKDGADCARIVLSGQTDLNALLGMVNRTHIFRFIAKPWHDYYLKGSVAQALAYREAMLDYQRLAAQAKKEGRLVDSGGGQETDNVLLISADTAELLSLSRGLTAHSYLDDIFSSLQEESVTTGNSVWNRRSLHVEMAGSPAHALLMAKDSVFSVVICDADTLSRDAVDFLLQFMELQPDCERLLLTAEKGVPQLIGAINDAHVFGVIGKPWSEYEVKVTLAQALCHRRLLLENRFLAGLVGA